MVRWRPSYSPLCPLWEPILFLQCFKTVEPWRNLLRLGLPNDWSNPDDLSRLQLGVTTDRIGVRARLDAEEERKIPGC